MKKINYELVKEFLGYDDEFFEYVESKITRVDSNDENARFFYGVFIKTNYNLEVEEFKICVPEIVDLFTAQVNVHELKHAHDIYMLFGKKLDKSDEEYERAAKKTEMEFVKMLKKESK